MELVLVVLIVAAVATGIYLISRSVKRGQKRVDATPFVSTTSNYTAPSYSSSYPEPVVRDTVARDYVRPTKKANKHSSSSYNPSSYNFGSSSSYDSGSSSSYSYDSGSSSSSDSGSSSCDSGGSF